MFRGCTKRFEGRHWCEGRTLTNYAVGLHNHLWPHLTSLPEAPWASVLPHDILISPNTFMHFTSTSPSSPCTWHPFLASLGQSRANQTFGNNFNQSRCKVSLCKVLSICTTCSQSYPFNTCLVIRTKQLIHLSMPINTPVIAKALENSSNPVSSNYLHDVLKFGLLLDHIIIASFASPVISALDKPNVFD